VAVFEPSEFDELSTPSFESFLDLVAILMIRQRKNRKVCYSFLPFVA
jgi:hypothetical protein